MAMAVMKFRFRIADLVPTPLTVSAKIGVLNDQVSRAVIAADAATIGQTTNAVVPQSVRDRKAATASAHAITVQSLQALAGIRMR